MGLELHRYPASSFGVVLGTAGQANLWHAVSRLNVSTGSLKSLVETPDEISTVFWMLALVLLCLCTLIYLVKLVRRPLAVKWELASSIHVNFFFMPFLVVLILGMVAPTPPFGESHFHISLLYIVVVPLLLLEIYLYTEWMYGVARSLSWGNPAYQLAMVGNIIGSGTASIVGDHALAIFLFAIGVIYFIIVLAALHTVHDTRSWIGLDAPSKLPAAVTARVHAETDKERRTYILSPASRCTSTSPILAHDELANRQYSALQVHTSGDNAGRAVYAANAESPEPALIASLSLGDSHDNASLPASPEPQRMSVNDDDSVLLSAGNELSDQVDLLASGEVFTTQLFPHSTNLWSLPPFLQPTLFLYVAPPSLLATSWLLLQGHEVGQGQCDDVCKSFASIGILFFFFMVVNVPRFFLRTPFSLAFWAFTFPSSALAMATMEFATSTGSPFLHVLALVFIVMSTVLWVSVSLATIIVPFRKGIDVLLLPRAVPR